LRNRLYHTDSFVKHWRQHRMQRMIELVQPPSHARILDLGGITYMWQLLDHSFGVTLVNLPGANPKWSDDRRYTYVEADACNLQNVFDDGSFDLVFSNSTIEHVGADDRQRHFAREVRRLGTGYWVQTPSSKCILEVHTGVPFYWHLPTAIIDRLHRSWKSKLPAWFDFISETRVISRQRMLELFPDASLYLERVAAFEKSYSVFRRCG
jgi:ubiquinone/menaquinone biosynthesis C-methylase UbiE